MSDEIKVAAYKFAETMPTNKAAQLGALIIEFVQNNYKKERVREVVDPLESTTPIKRISMVPESTCIACEG